MNKYGTWDGIHEDLKKQRDNYFNVNEEPYRIVLSTHRSPTKQDVHYCFKSLWLNEKEQEFYIQNSKNKSDPNWVLIGKIPQSI